MKKLFGDIYHSKYKIEIIGALLLSIGVMCFLCYEDAVCLAVWSTNIWDCLFEGRFFDYYLYCIQNMHDLPMTCPGGIILPKLPTAIWCLPIWIAQYFFGVEIKTSVLCMVWYRLFFVLLLMILVVYVRKICQILNYEDNQISIISLLCATSVFVQVSISYAGQTDLEWILPGVIAFYYLLKEDWKKFYIFVNISILIKPYFLPVAVLMILYCEKDVLKILGRIILSVWTYPVIMFIFGRFPGYSEAKVHNGTLTKMIAEYLNNAVLFPYGWISLIIVFSVIICAIVYFCNAKDKVRIPQTMVSIVALFYCLWFLFACENFYRMIMIVPWVYIALFREREKNELLLWIVTLYSYSMIFMYRFHEVIHFFNVKSGMYASVIPQRIINKTSDFFYTISDKMGSTFYHMSYIFNGLFVGMTIIIVALLIPRIYDKYVSPIQSENRESIQRVLIWLNILAVVPLVLSVMISFVA